MPRRLLDALQRGPLVLDGAMGTQLLHSGFHPQRDFLGQVGCCEVLNLTRPEQVRAVHESYLDAGCDVIATNSFLAAPHQLAARGLGDRAAQINRAAARAAREAADAWADASAPRWVLGSLGPGPADPAAAHEELEESWQAQARWLAEEGVDGLLLETFTDPELVPRALAAARRGLERARRPLPVLVSLAAGPMGQLADGEPLESIFDSLSATPPDLLALNCFGNLAQLDDLLARLRARWSGHLGTYPSAGLPSGDPPRWPMEPSEFAAQLVALARKHRLSLVGGCCGTRPLHIRALAKALDRPGFVEDEPDPFEDDDESLGDDEPLNGAQRQPERSSGEEALR